MTGDRTPGSAHRPHRTLVNAALHHHHTNNTRGRTYCAPHGADVNATPAMRLVPSAKP